jgi:hypothetical protein
MHRTSCTKSANLDNQLLEVSELSMEWNNYSRRLCRNQEYQEEWCNVINNNVKKCNSLKHASIVGAANQWME